MLSDNTFCCICSGNTHAAAHAFPTSVFGTPRTAETPASCVWVWVGVRNSECTSHVRVCVFVFVYVFPQPVQRQHPRAAIHASRTSVVGTSRTGESPGHVRGMVVCACVCVCVSVCAIVCAGVGPVVHRLMVDRDCGNRYESDRLLHHSLPCGRD